MTRSSLIALLIAFLLIPSAVFAYSETHDEYSLELKGFSPEMIEPVQMVVDRMEGRYPIQPPSKIQQLFYNFRNNNWIDSLQPFGYDKVDPPAYPKRP